MQRLRIQVRPSARLSIALGVTHVAAAAVVWLAGLPWLGSAVLTIAIAASFALSLRRHAALSEPRAIVGLEFNDEGGAAFQVRSGEWIESQLLESTYVSPHLTVVNLRPRTRLFARCVLLLPDSIDGADFRRLRTWLRWKGRGAQGTATAGEP